MRRRVVNSPAAVVEHPRVSRAATRAADRRLAGRRRRAGDDRRTTWATAGRRRRANCRTSCARISISKPSPPLGRKSGSPARRARGCSVRPTADTLGSRSPPAKTRRFARSTFVDERTGFAVGDLGTILATNDGGRTWQVQRRGGERAALLLALAGETDVPLELVGKVRRRRRLSHGREPARIRRSRQPTCDRARRCCWPAPRRRTSPGNFRCHATTDTLAADEVLADAQSRERRSRGRAARSLLRPPTADVAARRRRDALHRPAGNRRRSPSFVEQLVDQVAAGGRRSESVCRSGRPTSDSRRGK